jgi:hypothetical protein
MDIWLNAVRASQGAAAENPAFITTWKTDNVGTSADNQITIPLNSALTYNFIVDWGDSSQDTITAWNQAELTHTYASAGTYTVTITGTCPRIYFNNGGDRLKIIAITNWGDVAWSNNQSSAFFGCGNITSLPDDHLEFWNTTLNVGTGMFRNNSLTALPEGMALAALTTGTSVFQNNSLTALPEGMALAALTTGTSMFLANTINTTDYSNLLINTEAANSNNDVSFHGGSSKYNAAGGVARTALINNQNWTITDGGAE